MYLKAGTECRLMEINMEMSCLQVLAIKATHEAYKMQMIPVLTNFLFTSSHHVDAS